MDRIFAVLFLVVLAVTLNACTAPKILYECVKHGTNACGID